MCKAFMEILFYFIVRRIFALNSKFRNKNDLLCARRDFNEKNCGVSTYYKGMFKPQISSIFHFDWVSDGWMAHMLGVKIIAILFKFPLLRHFPLALWHCLSFSLRTKIMAQRISILSLTCFSMTSLLTHTVAHFTRPSFRPKTNYQTLKTF